MRNAILWGLLSILCSLPVISQEKMVLDDQTGIVDQEVEKALKEKLEAEGIELTGILDYKARCDYHYAGLTRKSGDLLLAIRDCEDELVGARNLGNRIFQLGTPEVSFLLSLAMKEIIDKPGHYMEVFESASGTGREGQPQEAAGGTSAPPAQEYSGNEHNTRYFFAPSAYNLKKGELYYNTVYFLLHDIQYGLSDYFSMGIGTTVIGLPMYFTPKISIPVGDKSAIAIGDLLLVGTYGTDALGNLAYASYSYGGNDGNISIGGGHLYTNENDFTDQTSSLVLNFSSMARMSPYIFFLTENYLMSANFIRYADYWTSDETGDYYVEEEFTQRNTFWYGIAGIRIVSKNRNYIAWQIGLTYVLNFPGDYPVKYNSWYHNARTEFNLVAFPTVSFTIKFGRNF